MNKILSFNNGIKSRKNLKVLAIPFLATLMISLTSCANESNLNKEENKTFQIEVDSSTAELDSIKLEKTILQNEIETLENTKVGLQDEIETLENARVDLQDEINLLKMDVSYLNENLYLFNTSLIDPSNDPIYYIVYKGESGNKCDDGTNTCVYSSLDDIDERICFSEDYYMIGYDNVFLRFTKHISKYLQDPSYLTMDLCGGQGFSYNYYVELEPGTIDRNPENTSKYNQFQALLVPLKDVINEKDWKYTYITAELIDLINFFNNGEYNFENENYTR